MIEQFASGLITMLLAKFVLNDIPHAIYGTKARRDPANYFCLAAKGVPAMYMFLYISSRGGTPTEASGYLDFPHSYASDFIRDMKIACISNYKGAFQVLQASGLAVGRSNFLNAQEIAARTTLEPYIVIDLIEGLYRVGYLEGIEEPLSLPGVVAPMIGATTEEFREARAQLLKAKIARIPPEFTASLPPQKEVRKTGSLYYLSPKGISFMEFLGKIIEAEQDPGLIPASWLAELVRSGVTAGLGDLPGTDLDLALQGFEIPVSSFMSIGLSAVSTISAVYPEEVYNEVNSWTGELDNISVEEFTTTLEKAVQLNLLYKTNVNSNRSVSKII